MLNKIKKISFIILKISFLLILSVANFNILFTVLEFFFIELKIREDTAQLFQLFIASLSFIIIPLLWKLIRINFYKKLALFILFTITLYSFGFFYSRKIFSSFKKADQYYKEASILVDKWRGVELNEKNIDLYFNDQRHSLELLKLASEINFGYEKWIKKFYENAYEAKKEHYNLEKRVFIENEEISKEEQEKKLNKINEKLKRTYYIRPFWMDFYLLEL